MNYDSTRISVLSAGMAALTSIGAYLIIPIGPVPIVLQNLFVLLTGLLLPPASAAGTMFLYLVLGAIGIPVFAGGTGGIAHFFGPTGGYLLSYLPAATIISLIASRKHEGLRVVLALLTGAGCIYLVGITWLILLSGMSLGQSLSVGLLPFLPGDLVKIAAAYFIGKSLKPQIHRFIARVE